MITYDTNKSVTVLKTDSLNNEATITGLTNDIEYTFTVKTYDNFGNVSNGVSVKKKTIIYYGNTSDPQGTKVIAGWMNSEGNLMLDDGTGTKAEIAKTSEVVVVSKGTVAEIAIVDNSSWSTYYSGTDQRFKGVFLSGRKVKLDSFVMSQYQVTQKLYMQVMGLTDEQNPSYHQSDVRSGENQENRPVENITWYQACAFCNELTKKTFGNTDLCVYYSDVDCQTPYTSEKANSKAIVYPAYNTETHKWTKTGYRLPTEAEWEFCARGGNPNAKDNNQNLIWNFAYAGVQSTKKPSEFINTTDTALNNYAWYTKNSGSSKTHEVGKKTPNTLGLYDMSGNVWEWCYDWYQYDADLQKQEADYKDSAGNVLNPLGVSTGTYRVLRGGYYNGGSCECSVSYRFGHKPLDKLSSTGFRLVRSTN